MEWPTRKDCYYNQGVSPQQLRSALFKVYKLVSPPNLNVDVMVVAVILPPSARLYARNISIARGDADRVKFITDILSDFVPIDSISEAEWDYGLRSVPISSYYTKDVTSNYLRDIAGDWSGSEFSILENSR